MKDQDAIPQGQGRPLYVIHKFWIYDVCEYECMMHMTVDESQVIGWMKIWKGEGKFWGTAVPTVYSTIKANTFSEAT